MHRTSFTAEEGASKDAPHTLTTSSSVRQYGHAGIQAAGCAGGEHLLYGRDAHAAADSDDGGGDRSAARGISHGDGSSSVRNRSHCHPAGSPAHDLEVA